ncbi:MAG: hypothetical protein LW704_04220 [Cryomorphaceae bacterium]|jgi:hypothetical protein|nr:hypothetical protein [Cryomorphaceae bacterium]
MKHTLVISFFLFTFSSCGKPFNSLVPVDEVNEILLWFLLVGSIIALWRAFFKDPFKEDHATFADFEGSNDFPLSFTLIKFGIKCIWEGCKAILGFLVAFFVIGSLYGMGIGVVIIGLIYLFRLFFTN